MCTRSGRPGDEAALRSRTPSDNTDFPTATVKWTNSAVDKIDHTVNANDNSFGPGLLKPSANFTFRLRDGVRLRVLLLGPPRADASDHRRAAAVNAHRDVRVFCGSRVDFGPIRERLIARRSA